MANFIVTYDLNGPRPSHAEMDAHLRQLNGRHGRVLETVWYVGCWLTEVQLREYLLSILSQNDQLLVARAKEAAWLRLLVTNASLLEAWEQYRD